MKRGKLYLLIALFSALLMSAGASPFGTVQSEGPFEIHRGQDSVIERSNTTLVVQTGDSIVSRAEILSLRTTAGAALAMGRDAQVDLVDSQTIRLTNGQAALSATAASGIGLEVEDLEIRPLPTSDAEDQAQPGFFAVSHTTEGRIVVYAVQRSFEIRPANGGDPVAMMTAGDTLRLTRDGEIWKTSADKIGQATGDGSQLSDDQKITNDDDDDKVLFGFLRLTPAVIGGAAVAGGAAVVVGGTVYYNDQQDDGDTGGGDDETSPVDPHEGDGDWNWEE
ncbi:hypothetical protein KQI84_18810 [bacterium]|nr:hypothetical protein [bacterium]